MSNSVNHVTGKVRVSPSDLVADVELAARRALAGLVNESHLFRRIYVDADEDFAKLVAEKLGKEVYDGMIAEIEKRVGGEFIRVGIFPLQSYTREVDTR